MTVAGMRWSAIRLLMLRNVEATMTFRGALSAALLVLAAVPLVILVSTGWWPIAASTRTEVLVERTVPPSSSTTSVVITTTSLAAVENPFPALDDDGVVRAIETPSGIVVPVLRATDSGWVVRTPCGEHVQITGGRPISRTHVVLDAGHGGHEPGSVGDDGLTESEVNLNVARRVAELLTSRGVDVVMTRVDDQYTELKTRGMIANNLGPYVFVSVHHNGGDIAGDGSPGAMSVHQVEKPLSIALATGINDGISELLGRIDAEQGLLAASDDLLVLAHRAETLAAQIESETVELETIESAVVNGIGRRDRSQVPLRPTTTLAPAVLGSSVDSDSGRASSESVTVDSASAESIATSSRDEGEEVGSQSDADSGLTAAVPMGVVAEPLSGPPTFGDAIERLRTLGSARNAAQWRTEAVRVHAGSALELSDEVDDLLAEAENGAQARANAAALAVQLERVEAAADTAEAVLTRVSVAADILEGLLPPEPTLPPVTIPPVTAPPVTRADGTVLLVPPPAPIFAAPRTTTTTTTPAAVVTDYEAPEEIEPRQRIDWVGGGNGGARTLRGRNGDKLWLLRNTPQLTTVLTENLFITNPTEELILADPDFLDEQAVVLADAITAYLLSDDLPRTDSAMGQEVDGARGSVRCVPPELGTPTSPPPPSTTVPPSSTSSSIEPSTTFGSPTVLAGVAGIATDPASLSTQPQVPPPPTAPPATAVATIPATTASATTANPPSSASTSPLASTSSTVVATSAAATVD